MKSDDSLKRIKAMAEALAKIQKAQDEQKAMQAMEEAEDDDMDLVADMLMEMQIFFLRLRNSVPRLRRSLTARISKRIAFLAAV